MNIRCTFIYFPSKFIMGRLLHSPPAPLVVAPGVGAVRCVGRFVMPTRRYTKNIIIIIVPYLYLFWLFQTSITRLCARDYVTYRKRLSSLYLQHWPVTASNKLFFVLRVGGTIVHWGFFFHNTVHNTPL